MNASKFLSLILIFTALGFLENASAQVDPSSALLLRSSGKAPTKDNLDSSRYQVRERPTNQQDERRLQSSPPSHSTPRPMEQSRPQTANNQDQNQLTEQSQNSIDKEAPSTNMSDAMQEILIGGTLENISEYKKLLDENDYRRNIVDLSIEPIYIYNNSSSNLWLREYFTSSSGFRLAADVWITPFFGFHTSYQTSFNASIRTAFAASGRTPVDHEWFNGGLRFRKFFGVTKQAPGIVFGLDFSEYQMKIDSDAQNRMGVKSSGAKLSIESILPTSETHQWNLGVSIVPRVDHKQINTGLSAQSGDSQESTRFGVSIGSRFVFSRKSQVYWRLTHEIEKNLFEGQSSINDARSGSPVDGVDVTNSFTIFSIGYTWGN